ncbi:hypothetical protein [Hippea alviniae]|uniref:hypothetical protein n=1 Tax=Hippea alviniae TaxID=1279027 RepID=UPI0003B4D1A3|nr:hypothetical protein [Hippea alviniae]
MNTVNITDKTVEIEVEGFDKLWSLKGKLTIPRKSINRAYLRPEGLKPRWLRVPGTYLPKVIAAGTYYGQGRKEFWNTHFREDCLVFDLIDFDYTRVVIDVDGAQEIIDKLS